MFDRVWDFFISIPKLVLVLLAFILINPNIDKGGERESNEVVKIMVGLL